MIAQCRHYLNWYQLQYFTTLRLSCPANVCSFGTGTKNVEKNLKESTRRSATTVTRVKIMREFRHVGSPGSNLRYRMYCNTNLQRIMLTWDDIARGSAMSLSRYRRKITTTGAGEHGRAFSRLQEVTLCRANVSRGPRACVCGGGAMSITLITTPTARHCRHRPLTVLSPSNLRHRHPPFYVDEHRSTHDLE